MSWSFLAGFIPSNPGMARPAPGEPLEITHRNTVVYRADTMLCPCRPEDERSNCKLSTNLLCAPSGACPQPWYLLPSCGRAVVLHL